MSEKKDVQTHVRQPSGGVGMYSQVVSANPVFYPTTRQQPAPAPAPKDPAPAAQSQPDPAPTSDKRKP